MAPGRGGVVRWCAVGWDGSAPLQTMMPAEPALHTVRFTIRRRDWWPTEFPAIVVWGGLSVVLLVGAVSLVLISRWLIPVSVRVFMVMMVWSGSRVIGIARFLVRGREDVVLRIYPTRVIAEGDPPVDLEARGVDDVGHAWLLWGGDGRYRCIIPKGAVMEEQVEALRAACRATGAPSASSAAANPDERIGNVRK